VAVGVGINVRQPPDASLGASWLGSHVSRLDAVAALVDALRVATRAAGGLSPSELADYAARDATLGRRVAAPVEGTVAGLLPTGELLVRDASGGPGPAASGDAHLRGRAAAGLTGAADQVAGSALAALSFRPADLGTTLYMAVTYTGDGAVGLP
jgi:hypothetical protein